MSTPLINSLSNEITQLTPDQQNQVLDFVRQLKSPHDWEERRQAILELAGSIPHDDIERMKQAIKEGCEQINPNAR
jgi:sulfur transfer protein SufE